jgi:uncharacterized protein YbaA (DUF1428 family)
LAAIVADNIMMELLMTELIECWLDKTETIDFVHQLSALQMTNNRFVELNWLFYEWC